MITAILAGVFIGLLVAQLGTPALALALCVAVGLAVFLAFLIAQLRFQHVEWRAARRQWKGLSPSPTVSPTKTPG